ncbi:MGDG synthase family glycosyltransferase [Brevibacillus ginsengisoli]|uniref:MGDG synthase family glycosyltransferase n=1 Tax=Brevibacillus ginsengisoli TaxID=363854 RepID=UPI003CF472AB
MKRRILICTEDWAGSGHRLAASALKQALEKRASNGSSIEVQVISGLRTVSPLLQKLSCKAYRTSLRYTPGLWEKLYQQEKNWGKAMKKPLGKWLGKRLLTRVIEEFAPDTVVATHAYCLAALSEAKKMSSVPFVLGSMPTDYYVNSFWVHPEVDFYVVAHEELSSSLQVYYGIPSEKIFSYGIPLRPPFAANHGRNKSVWKQEIGLKPTVFTVLVTGGEDGYGDFLPLLARLLQSGRPLQIVIITGKNASLFQMLREFVPTDTAPHTVHILGYVEEMWAYIGAADAVISKPGGLTCSEAMAMGTPLIVYRPLPGHEQRNSRFLERIGVTSEASSLDDITRFINRWLIRNEEWKHTCSQIQQHGKPDAAFDIADHILNRV